MKRKASWRVKPLLLWRLCIVLLFVVLLSVSTLWSVQSAQPNHTTQITNHDFMTVAEGKATLNRPSPTANGRVPVQGSDMAIIGPENGSINIDYRFTVTLLSPDLTEPITYTWDVTDSPKISYELFGENVAFQLKWSIPGIKTIDITASHEGGIITGTTMIIISILGPTLTPTPTATSTPLRTSTPLPTSTPTLTPTPTSGPLFLPLVLLQLTPTPTPTPTPPPISNGDFESGQLSGWTAGGELPQSVTDRDKHGGNFAALLGNPDWGVAFPDEIPAGSAYMEQVVNVPSEGVSQLTFWYRMTSYDVLIGGAGRLFDSLDVTINGIKGDLIYRTGNPNPSGQGPPPWDSGWTEATLDLSAYRGQTVTLRFGVWNREYPPVDGLDIYNTWVYVDDVSIVVQPGYEENDTAQTAYGPLISGQVYEAYPDDQDDWYYFVITNATSAEVVVTDYASDGQLVLYQELADGKRRIIANDGRGLSTMRLPNEINPNAMTNLSPGKYLVRIYTTANYSTDELYRLQVQYE